MSRKISATLHEDLGRYARQMSRGNCVLQVNAEGGCCSPADSSTRHSRLQARTAHARTGAPPSVPMPAETSGGAVSKPRFWDSCLHPIRPCKNQTTDCSKTRLRINVAELHLCHEFWHMVLHLVQAWCLRDAPPRLCGSTPTPVACVVPSNRVEQRRHHHHPHAYRRVCHEGEDPSQGWKHHLVLSATRLTRGLASHEGRLLGSSEPGVQLPCPMEVSPCA
jgi:hypothetical protein